MEDRTCQSISELTADVCNEADGPSNANSTGNCCSTGTSSRKRTRKVVSPIWSCFEKCEDNFARCLICGSKYQHSNNTSNLAKVDL